MPDDYRFAGERFILVGRVSKPHGLAGEVKVHSLLGEAASLKRFRRVVLVDRRGELSPPLEVEKMRFQGKSAIVKLARVDDREMAEAVREMGVLVDRKELPDLEEDAYSWPRFYDLPVFTVEGRELGYVATIFSNGAQDIMVVRDGAREYLVPLIETIIRERTEERVVIAPPPGLLEINAGDSEK